MGREHNKKGQRIIYDAETGKRIKFTDQEYDRFLDLIWVHKGIKPNYNFNKEIQDESKNNL
jgi:hypothetical protein